MSKRLMVGLIMVFMLSACGQTGPLYRPDAIETVQPDTNEAK